MVKVKEKVQSLLGNTRFRLFLFVIVIVVIVAIAIIVMRSGPDASGSGGAAKVARISAQISSVPGSQKLSQQYLSTLLRSNKESAQQALKKGGSAIPTLVDTGYHYALAGSLAAQGQLQGMSSCLAACQACCQKRKTAADILNQLVQAGQIAPVVAAQLNKLSESGASVSDYAAKLNQLVQEGKITRAQANQLLSAYKQEHEKGTPANANDLVDLLQQSGAISPQVASQLKQLSDSGASVGAYQTALDQMVSNGLLTRKQADRLLAAYRKQRGLPTTPQSDELLNQMASLGNVTPDVVNQLRALSNKNVPVDDYKAALQRLVTAGKLTPAQAQRLLSAYQAQQGQVSAGGTGSTDSLIQSMQDSGSITPSTAAALKQLSQSDLSANAYQEKLDKMVRDGALSPSEAQRLLKAYRAKHPSRETASTTQMLSDMLNAGNITPDTATQLRQLSSKNVPISDYDASLQKLVQEGKLTPAQASRLLASYKHHHAGMNASSDQLVDSLLSSGSLTPATASELKSLAAGGASVNAYQASLDRLVREGKLTPAQAKKLLATYKRHHVAGKSPSTQLVDSLLSSGSLAPATASELKRLAAGDASVNAYQASLARLVREGKISPSAAQKLLAAYKLGHGMSPASAADSLISQMQNSGNITAAVASQLKRLSNSHLSAGAYKAALNRLVSEGKLTPEQAAQLLKAHESEAVFRKPSPTSQLIQEMEASGKLTPAAASQLRQLAKSGISVGAYGAAIQSLVRQGKLTPEQAKKLLATYRHEHLQASGLLSSEAAIDHMNLSSAAKTQLKQLLAKKSKPGDYAAALNKMVADGTISSEQAKQLLKIYRRDHPAQSLSGQSSAKDIMANAEENGRMTPDAANELNKLSQSGASTVTYAKKLNQLVENGKLAPQDAQLLLTAYRTQNGDTSVAPGASSAIDRLERAQQKEALRQQVSKLNSLQQAYQEQQAQKAQQQAEKSQQAAATKAFEKANAEQKIEQQYLAAISGQAKQLISSWNTATQKYMYKPPKAKKASAKGGSAEGSKSAGSSKQSSEGASQKATFPMVKSGTIMFAVLDTAVNSDQPGPVMATIVSGKLKGAKMLGTLSQTPDGERVMLSFTSLTKPDWPITISINAVAINPDTARTAIASDVDHHYLLRFGALFASNFLQGYAQAIQQSGQTQVNNSGTTTTQNPNLSPKEKLFVGLGQVGQKLSQVTNKLVDRKPTVLVDAGVGLGILFTKDVAQPKF